LGKRQQRRVPFEPAAAGHVPNRRGSTYGRRRLWITFWREFSGVFWGDFWEATGPGASVRGDFSADGAPMARWASANFDFFRGFFAFLVRFLPVFGPYFALFPSMSYAYLYVHNFFPASLAWKLHSLHRRGRRARPPRRVNCERREWGERRNGENGTAFNAENAEGGLGSGNDEIYPPAAGPKCGMTNQALSPTRRRRRLWRAG